MRLAIIGGGSWGTALAIVLSPRFETIRLWVYEQDLAERITHSRENDVYLPGFRVPGNVCATWKIEKALEDADMVLGVMPSQHARVLYSAIKPHLHPSTIVVSATKGLERKSLLRISEVVRETIPHNHPVAVLSGPTFAREVA